MGSGILQIAAFGEQDAYLTGNPQMTFFKIVYKRHTNFAIESMPLDIDGNNKIDLVMRIIKELLLLQIKVI